MEQHRMEIEDFLANQVGPVLEPLTVDIIKARPENIAQFCVGWLSERLRAKNTRREKSSAEISDEEDDLVEDEAFKARKSKNSKRNRSAVSAEVYGEFNRKEEFRPPVHPKSEEAITRILVLVSKSVLFKGLDDKDARIVIDAMQGRLCYAGETIIQEGEGGDVLYIVDEGEFDCHKKIDGVATYLRTYKVGEAFGELALLYNAPRAATITAKTSGRLYALDRNTFNSIVKGSAVRRKKLYEDALKKVELLDSVDPYERLQICDVLKEAKYSPEEYVIRQGDAGDRFFIVVEGRLIAERQDPSSSHCPNPAQETKVVYQYKEGDYFGEIALVRNIPRQASVKVLTYSTVVSIDRSAFKRLLGPIEQILRRNERRYTEFWNFAENRN